MGQNNKLYDNVTFPKGAEALNQFYKQMVPDTGAFDVGVVTDAMDALFDKIGDGVLVTHSAGGGPGWSTAIRNSHVKGVISLEPGTFPFPQSEAPATEATTSPFPAAPTPESIAQLKWTLNRFGQYFNMNVQGLAANEVELAPLRAKIQNK